MTEKIKQSPLPPKAKPTASQPTAVPTSMEGLNFPETIKQIILGRKVTKLEWGNKEFYGFLNGEFLSIHKPDGKNYQWIVSLGDLMGADYKVI